METSTSSVLHAGSFVGRQAGRGRENASAHAPFLDEKEQADERHLVDILGKGREGRKEKAKVCSPFPILSATYPHATHPPTLPLLLIRPSAYVGTDQITA